MASPASRKRVLICEGSEGAFFPDVRYVIQGKGEDAKVFVTEGAEKINKNLLHEDAGGSFTIVESLDKLELVEREGKQFVKDGRWFVEGVYQRAGVKNANGRTYSRKLWERLIESSNSPMMASLKQRAMVGVFEHPADGRTRGPEIALVTTNLKLNEDNTVWGRSELLDTPNGRILQELTLKKVRWGVSSRGTGTIDDKGNVNEADFMAECWDAVMRPSTAGAFPRLVSEDGTVVEDADPSKLPGNERRKALVAQVTEALGKPPTAAEINESTSLVAYTLGLLRTVQPVLAPEEDSPASAIFKIALKRMQEAEEIQVQAAVEESARRAQADPKTSGVDDSRIKAVSKVLERLSTRAAAALKEAEERLAKLTETEAELGQVRQRLVQVESEKTTLTAKLTAATAAVVALKRRTVAEDAQPNAITEAIAEVPGLERYKELLEAVDPKRIEEAIALLLPDVLTEAVPAPAPAPTRGRLPGKLQITESIAARKQPSVGEPPAMVGIAAAAIARQQKATAVAD